MKETEPIISVIMSTYNDEKKVGKSIESILNQTYKNFEFLIVDDFSQDSTLDVLKHYEAKDRRVKIFTNKQNIGLTKSLNKLIFHSKGEYIARQDSDDFSEKNRFKKQINFLIDNEYDACGTRAKAIQSSKKIPGKSFYLPMKLHVKIKNPLIHGTLLINKEVLNKLGNYDESFYYAQDYKLLNDLIDSGFKIANLNNCLYNLNMEDNISTIYSDKQKYFADCVRKNINP